MQYYLQIIYVALFAIHNKTCQFSTALEIKLNLENYY